ncbi:MAG: hypothetical protein OXG19_02655 [Chloroflexi bacterium]|nr:hypothetical protein [Chloroflexota bacterium]
MMRRLGILALVIGLAGTFLSWERAATDAPDEVSGAAGQVIPALYATVPPSTT